VTRVRQSPRSWEGAPPGTVLAHLPFLRLESEEVPFGAGRVWRMPFEVFDALTLGAFGDERRSYEQTEPVFYRIDLAGRVPSVPFQAPSHPDCASAVLQTSWAAAPEIMPALDEIYVASIQPAWLMLLLGAPPAAPESPAASMLFAVPEEDESFATPAGAVTGIQLDGYAREELLFHWRTTSTPLADAAVERAASAAPLLEQAMRHDDLRPALRALAAVANPSLASPEQDAVCTAALELLLLPDVRTSIQATFGRRVAAALGGGAEIVKLARGLYDARSRQIHGRTVDGRRGAVSADGVVLLAEVVTAIARETAAGTDLEELRAALDTGEPFAAAPILQTAARPRDRVRGRDPYHASGWTFGGSMGPADGYILSWSPLVGMACQEDLRIDFTERVSVLGCPSDLVIGLEDKDVSRNLREVAIGDRTVACLACARLARPGEDKLRDWRSPQSTDDLLSRRDRAVTALRLAGHDRFVDPDLLSTYMFDDVGRAVYPSVFRNAVLARLEAPPEASLTADDLPGVQAHWRTLIAYEEEAAHDDIDHMLALFRRAHDREFLEPSARAGLLIRAMELMLGRPEPELVTELAGPASAAAAWFADEGWRFRNAVAHGSWRADDDEPLEHLLEIVRAAIERLLAVWIEGPRAPRARPRDLLATALAGEPAT
jgi:hypothetical protein